MIQLRLIVKRLRKPSVIASLTSQIITMLVLLGIQINTTLVTSIISTLTSIFIILGIFSNPDAKKRGYGDDISLCSKCNNMTQHVMVAGQMICSGCGCSSNDLPS